MVRPVRGDLAPRAAGLVEGGASTAGAGGVALAAGFLDPLVLATVARFFPAAAFAGLRTAGVAGLSFGAGGVDVFAFETADFVTACLGVAAFALALTVREARFGALAGLAAVLARLAGILAGAADSPEALAGRLDLGAGTVFLAARLAGRVFGADAAGVLALAGEAIVLAAGRAVFRPDVFSDFIGQLKTKTGEVAPSTRRTLSPTPRQRPTERFRQRFRHSCTPARFLGRCQPFQPMP